MKWLFVVAVVLALALAGCSASVGDQETKTETVVPVTTTTEPTSEPKYFYPEKLHQIYLNNCTRGASYCDCGWDYIVGHYSEARFLQTPLKIIATEIESLCADASPTS